MAAIPGYGGIVYGYAGYRFLFLAESRHYSAGFIFALAAWAAAASAAIYLLNAPSHQPTHLDGRATRLTNWPCG